MPCAPTLRVLTFVAVYSGIVAIGRIVQVKLQRDRRIILKQKVNNSFERFNIAVSQSVTCCTLRACIIRNLSYPQIWMNVQILKQNDCDPNALCCNTEGSYIWEMREMALIAQTQLVKSMAVCHNDQHSEWKWQFLVKWWDILFETFPFQQLEH